MPWFAYNMDGWFSLNIVSSDPAWIMVPCDTTSYNCSFYCLNPVLYTDYWDDVMLGLEHGEVGVVVQRLVTVVMWPAGVITSRIHDTRSWERRQVTTNKTLANSSNTTPPAQPLHFIMQRYKVSRLSLSSCVESGYSCVLWKDEKDKVGGDDTFVEYVLWHFSFCLLVSRFWRPARLEWLLRCGRSWDEGRGNNE